MMTEQPPDRPGAAPPPAGYRPHPGYGAAPGQLPPGYGPPPGFWTQNWPGPIPQAAPVGPVRPGRIWIVLTWVLLTAVTVTALTWGLSTVRSGFSAAFPSRTFAGGETIAVDLDPADAPAVYVGLDSPGGVGFEVSYPFSSPVDAQCEIAGDSQDMALLQPERNVVLTADGVEWHQLFLIREPRTGEYELRCTGEGVRFGVANDLPAGLFTQFAWLLIGVFAAAAIAVVTTIVLVRKRGAALRRFPPSTGPVPPARAG
jgi:hypothetical protein